MTSRRFGEEIPNIESAETITNKGDFKRRLSWIKRDEIGSKATAQTPFGTRQIHYCDYTASARASASIEDYIRENVLPYYGNTHSSVTVTAEQTTLFMHEARQEIRAMTGAGDLDDVIFTGTGATAAVDLLIHFLNPTEDNGIVVVHSVMEHHSNLLPWRDNAVKCYEVAESENGGVDINELEATLLKAKSEFPNKRYIAALPACSNLTGILLPVAAISRIIKKHGFMSIWDYAAAAPYVDINVNGDTPIDAVFFSGHKFPGGVSSPGVLIVKKALISQLKPKRTGGGTVFFVNGNGEWYLKEAEHREEGGTADSVGAVRLAMAVKLKRSIPQDVLLSSEHAIVRVALDHLTNHENIVLLGPPRGKDRLAVFSFLVREPRTRLFYHHNYISVLLNDLFGIQTRAGCMCAGPYAHKLLGIDDKTSSRILNAIKESEALDRTHLRRHAEYSENEHLRPGFTRLSLPYFLDLDTVKNILECIQFVADHAGDFMHLYQLNCESAEWHHTKQRVFHGRRWLGHAVFTADGMKSTEHDRTTDEPLDNLEKCLEEAKRLAADAIATRNIAKIPDGRTAINVDFSDLRWYVLPIEVAENDVNGASTVRHQPTFTPRVYETFEDEETRDEVIETDVPVETKDHDEKDESCTIEGTCPLDGQEYRGKGINGDVVGLDNQDHEEVKESEDWNRRVVVKSQQLVPEQEKTLPWQAPSLEMYKKVTEVIHKLHMIKEGDRILVCLSGGKDSLSLLHILHFYQQRCRKNRSTNFDLGAITVDPGSAEYNPRPLIDYCRSLNIDYFYEEQDIIGAAKKVKNLRSICAFCSRMKRGRLAAAAVHHGWNVLAMGQHLDDLAESFFIAAFQNGNLSTMKAQYATKDGTLRVIRPLVLVREKALRQFAEEKKLPIVAENCPACFNQATERHRIKQLLAQQELVFPELFNSLRSALWPLLLVDSAHTSEMRTQAVKNIVENQS